MRVLYATDGSAPAREAERLIKSLFDPTRVRVHTFAVAAEPVFMAPLVDGNFEMARLDVPPIDAEQVALEAAEHLADEGFMVSSGSGMGDPAREILRRLDEKIEELVVLGASHASWMGNLLLGSVGMHVLHHAPGAVLITHRAPAGAHEIVLAADGSKDSLAAMEIASQTLDRSRCTFTVATVVPHQWTASVVYSPAPPFGGYSDHTDLEKESIERAWQVVERARGQLKSRGFTSEGAVLMGAAGPQLLKETDNVGADLVVAGARGLGPVRRAFLGSVSDQLARHAPATLVVHRSA